LSYGLASPLHRPRQPETLVPTIFTANNAGSQYAFEDVFVGARHRGYADIHTDNPVTYDLPRTDLSNMGRGVAA